MIFIQVFIAHSCGEGNVETRLMCVLAKQGQRLSIEVQREAEAADAAAGKAEGMCFCTCVGLASYSSGDSKERPS